MGSNHDAMVDAELAEINGGTGTLFVHFEASETLYEGEVVAPDQPERLTIGPFEFVQLTYEWLRIGPDGEHFAIHRDGLWEIIEEIPQVGYVQVMDRDTVVTNGMLFSDVTISTEEG